MSLVDDLGSNQNNQSSMYTPTQRIPVLVKAYDVSDENPANHKIVAQNWLTGEDVIVSLRGNNPELKGIKDFHSDPSPEAPVTTKVGGIIIVESAYENKKATKANGVRTLSAGRLNRISDSVSKGYPVTTAKSKIRVGEVRMKDLNDPSKGYKQSIAIMHTDRRSTIENVEQLENAILDALDPALLKKDQDGYKRPGALAAFVRLVDKHSGESNLNEFYGGFYNDPSTGQTAPKTREMVKQDLQNNTSWKKVKHIMGQALQDPDRYVGHLDEGCYVNVAPLTVEKSRKGNTSRIMKSSIQKTNQDGSTDKRNGFVDGVCAVILSSKGIPSAVYVKPSNSLPLVTMTGEASPSETVDHQRRSMEAAEKYMASKEAKKPQQAPSAAPAPAPAPAPQPATPEPQPAPAPVQQEAAPQAPAASSDEDLDGFEFPEDVAPQNPKVTITPRSDSRLVAEFPSEELAKEAASTIHCRVKENRILIESFQLPALYEVIKEKGFDTETAPTNQVATPAPQAAPQAEPQQAPAAQAPVEQTPAQQEAAPRILTTSQHEQVKSRLDRPQSNETPAQQAMVSAPVAQAPAEQAPAPAMQEQAQPVQNVEIPNGPTLDEALGNAQSSQNEPEIDLSTIDFNDVDLDQALANAFGAETSSTNNTIKR